MGKYASMLGVETSPAPVAGGKYASLLGISSAAKPDVGNIEGAIRGAADSATFGFSDEIEGFARGVLTDDTISEGIDKARARHEASPGAAYLGGQVAGAFVPGVGLAGQVARGATKLSRLGRAAGAGAVQGAAYGAGSGEGFEDRVAGAASGAAIGAPLGAAGGAIAEKLGRKIAPAVSDDVADQIPLTKGQRSGDLRQIQREEALRNKGGGAQDIIRQFDDQQGRAIESAAGSVIPGGDDLAVAAEQFQGAMTSARQAAKRKVKGAYKAVETSPGVIDAQSFTKPGGLFEKFDNVVDDLGLNIEASEAVEPIIDKLKSKLAGKKEVRISDLDDLRKTMTGSTSSPNSGRAVGMLKDTFDDFLEEVVETAMFRGDDEILSKLRKARSLHSDYMKTFTAKKGGDKPGKIIEALTSEDATPTEAVNYLLGAARINKKGAAEAAKRISSASPDAQAALRQASWARLTRKDDGTMKDPGKIVTDVRTFIQRDPALAKALVGEKAMADMGKFVDQVAKTVTPKGALNTSGSGWTVFRGINQAFGGVGGAAATGVFINPTVGMGILLKNVGGSLKNARAARKAIRQAQAQRQAPGRSQELAVPLAAAMPQFSAQSGAN